MGSAAIIRNQVEAALRQRVPGALSPHPTPPPERIACGIESVDDLLHGGIPVGKVTELVGPNGSGRTSIAFGYIATITHSEKVCAWIDVVDSFDPETAAASGVDLAKLLWVRCGSTVEQPLQAQSRKDGLTLGTLSKSQPRPTGGGSPHPRLEDRDMPEAIRAMMQTHGGMYDKHVNRDRRAQGAKVGTPGAPNRPLTYRSEEREEQINSDRLPPRRGENLSLPLRGLTPQAMSPRCAEPQPRRVARLHSGEPMRFQAPAPNRYGRDGSVWKALDQALRSADLILQGGGFSALVLDLGSVPAETAWRIPMATWFRFRAACERSRASLLLLTQHPCARSSAELIVKLERGTFKSRDRVMTGICYQANVERSRSKLQENRVVFIRKPPQPERPGQWTSEASWATK